MIRDYFDNIGKITRFLKQKSSERVEQLERESCSIIKNAIKKHGKDRVGVASSFGKDSIVTLFLVRKFLPDVPIFWTDTGIEYPETYEFIDWIIKEWKLDVTKVKGDVTFWEIADHYGLPTPDKRICTAWLKVIPLQNKQLEFGINTMFTGVRRDESMLRRKYAMVASHSKFRSHTLYKYAPILEWLDIDLWAFINKYNLPCNSLYDMGIPRTGCWACTVGQNFNAMGKLEKTHPQLYKQIEPWLEKDYRFYRLPTGTWAIKKMRDPRPQMWLMNLVMKNTLSRNKKYKELMEYWKKIIEKKNAI